MVNTRSLKAQLKRAEYYFGPVNDKHDRWLDLALAAFNRDRAREKDGFGRLDERLSKRFRAFLHAHYGLVDFVHYSFCALGASFLLKERYDLDEKDFVKNSFPAVWKMYAAPEQYGIHIVQRGLEEMADGELLFLHNPNSHYKRAAEQYGDEAPTHVMVKIDGQFYHVMGAAVYVLSPAEVRRLIKNKGWVIKGVGIITNEYYNRVWTERIQSARQILAMPFFGKTLGGLTGKRLPPDTEELILLNHEIMGMGFGDPSDNGWGLAVAYMYKKNYKTLLKKYWLALMAKGSQYLIMDGEWHEGWDRLARSMGVEGMDLRALAMVYKQRMGTEAPLFLDKTRVEMLRKRGFGFTGLWIVH